MAELRPEIPDPMKREVRQRCGFGCVICGKPIYAYDHMIDCGDVKEHKADNLTLLCDSHHREKTDGLLPLAQVQKRNASPHNIQHGVSSPYGLHLDGPRFDVLIGGNQFFEERSVHGASVLMIPVSIDDVDLLWFTIDGSGNLLLSAQICDKTNAPVLSIRENELTYSVTPWDIEFVGRTLTVREGAGHIFFEIEFCPPNALTITRAHLMLNNSCVRIKREHICISNMANKGLVVKGNSGTRCTMGLHLGTNERRRPAALSF